jgi:hypothetical protein
LKYPAAPILHLELRKGAGNFSRIYANRLGDVGGMNRPVGNHQERLDCGDQLVLGQKCVVGSESFLDQAIGLHAAHAIST